MHPELIDISRRKRALVLAIATAGFAGCTAGKQEPSSNQERESVYVVATTGMVADLIHVVGGEAVEVQQLMGAGVDPHLYKPTRDDVQAISRADAVFYSGLMLEGKMADTLIKVGRSKPVYAVTELIDESTLLEAEDAPDHFDPHVWMDVSRWSRCVEAVQAALTTLIPERESQFATNAEQYLAELKQLHAYALTSIRSIPEPQRVLLTSHDAFSYFGRAYGLEVLGVQGISTESEAGLERINSLVDLLVERTTPAVFVESSVSSKNVQALVDGSRARGHEVRIGGELFSDAMGPAGEYEGTYIGMIDHNVTLVVRGLGGEAPIKGMQGKLASPEVR